MQSVNLPYTQGMNYGMGINLITGEVAGKIVEPGQETGPRNAEGGKASYNLDIIRSYEDLQTSMGIDVEASGHYGLFNAEGKFAFTNQTRFNSQSTFVFARVVVENAFLQCEDALLDETNGAPLIKQGKEDLFRKRFGDGFVRGIRTGGEFFAVMEVSSSSKTEQNEVAAQLKVACQGIIAGGEVNSSLSSETKEKMERSDIHIITYQQGGKEDEISLVKDINDVLNRLRDFPKIVTKNPTPYSVQVANYTTLKNYPEGPSPIDIENQKETLKEYAQTHWKLITEKNNVDFLQLHPEYFVNPPDAIL
ncbi:hypothetical protein PVA17_21985 [Lysinibacillus sp. CNPSo 3705]|uniref:hypothetical protein n=1 Tax=Lysinibacillus sp. CNPSo 3705 TaxID=3028148 RepID=UPI002363D148|nr:hypothetical protein [Lysinibacillus sp. CNPSo 3705]MDD1505395.1 hypothetical protein [Lysinibacillus sp. CNPSo 3705]